LTSDGDAHEVRGWKRSPSLPWYDVWDTHVSKRRKGDLDRGWDCEDGDGRGVDDDDADDASAVAVVAAADDDDGDGEEEDDDDVVGGGDDDDNDGDDDDDDDDDEDDDDKFAASAAARTSSREYNHLFSELVSRFTSLSFKPSGARICKNKRCGNVSADGPVDTGNR
jgi:hypothetical protein